MVVPGVVLFVQLDPLLFEPQAARLPTSAMPSRTATSILRIARRRRPRPNSTTQARTAPPPVFHGSCRGASFDAVQTVVLAVVVMVSVMVAGACVPAVMVAVAELSEQVAGRLGLLMVVVTAQLSAIDPVYEVVELTVRTAVAGVPADTVPEAELSERL